MEFIDVKTPSYEREYVVSRRSPRRRSYRRRSPRYCYSPKRVACSPRRRSYRRRSPRRRSPRRSVIDVVY